MSVSYLFNHFIAASFIGWIYECIYCTVKTTIWQNRGFLFGPVCPIYGFGFVAGKLTFKYLIPFIRNGGLEGREVDASVYVLRNPANIQEILMIFLVSALGCAVLEYFTSWLLEKLFHARWWDYSQDPLNLNGRICLPATAGFGLAGVVIAGYMLPYLDAHMQIRFPVPVEELLSLLFMFFLAADLVLSAAAATRLLDRIEAFSTVFDEKLETSYAPIGKAQRAAAERIVTVRDSAAGMLGTMKSGAGDVLGTMKSGAGDMLGTVKSGAGDMLDTVKEGAADVLGSMKDGAAGVLGTAKDSTTEWLELLRNGTIHTAGKMAGFGKGAAERILAPFQKNTLMNIQKYSSSQHQGAASRIKAFLTGGMGEKETGENEAGEKVTRENADPGRKDQEKVTETKRETETDSKSSEAEEEKEIGS